MADVQRFLQEDITDPDYGALSKEELEKLQQFNQETITSLEADIKLLKKKLMQFGPSALPNKDFQLICRPDGSSNLEEVENRLQKEVEDHAARLKETMRLTGVTIEKVHRQVLELDDAQCKKQFSLELKLFNRKVLLTYNLEEFLAASENTSNGPKVSWFEIKFEEDINEAVGTDVANAADALAIHSVFSLLKSYLQWQTTRDQTVSKFTEMYPDNVSQFVNDDGKICLRITNPKRVRPEFIIEWSRKTVNAQVQADLSLQVNAPSELIEMDSTDILGTASDMFAGMVKSLGLDKAIDSLIHLVVLEGQPGQQKASDDQNPEPASQSSDRNSVSASSHGSSIDQGEINPQEEDVI